MMAQKTIGDFAETITGHPLHPLLSERDDNVTKPVIAVSREGTPPLSGITWGGCCPSSPRSKPAPLTVQEAQEFALRVVRQLPRGYRFTMMGLFGNVKLCGSNRGRAAMLTPLRQAGLIRAVGLTRQDQDARNRGYATLWEVRT